MLLVARKDARVCTDNSGLSCCYQWAGWHVSLHNTTSGSAGLVSCRLFTTTKVVAMENTNVWALILRGPRNTVQEVRALLGYPNNFTPLRALDPPPSILYGTGLDPKWLDNHVGVSVLPTEVRWSRFGASPMLMAWGGQGYPDALCQALSARYRNLAATAIAHTMFGIRLGYRWRGGQREKIPIALQDRILEQWLQVETEPLPF